MTKEERDKKIISEWKVLDNINNNYVINDKGFIKSIPRKMASGNSGYRMTKECIMKATPRSKKNQYLIVTIDSSKYYVHRLVASVFIPNPNNLPQVNHINGIKTDNRVDNLEWATPSKNIQHAWQSGLCVSLKGEEKYNSKLTNKQVLEIKTRLQKESATKIAKEFGVKRELIKDINTGRTWKHIKLENE